MSNGTGLRLLFVGPPPQQLRHSPLASLTATRSRPWPLRSSSVCGGVTRLLNTSAALRREKQRDNATKINPTWYTSSQGTTSEVTHPHSHKQTNPGTTPSRPRSEVLSSQDLLLRLTLLNFGLPVLELDLDVLLVSLLEQPQPVGLDLVRFQRVQARPEQLGHLEAYKNRRTRHQQCVRF
jgi:hypothetical protein